MFIYAHHRVKNAFFLSFLICEVVGVDPYGSILAEPSHVNEKSNRTGQEKLPAKTSRKIPSKIEWDLTNGPLRRLIELLNTQV